MLDETPGLRAAGAASRWWLDGSLAALAGALEAMGSRLILRRGTAADIVAEVAAETGAGMVVWSRAYDPATVARDTALKAGLKGRGIEAESFNGALLIEPWTLKTGGGTPYRVFTPFWRAARPAIGEPEPQPAPDRLAAPQAWPRARRG